MQRQHHYLVFAQLIILSGLVLFSIGAQGLQFVAQYLPLLITTVLFFGSLRLCVRIVYLVDPDYKKRRAGHMHGSMLPQFVFEPDH